MIVNRKESLNVVRIFISVTGKPYSMSAKRHINIISIYLLFKKIAAIPNTEKIHHGKAITLISNTKVIRIRTVNILIKNNLNPL